MTLSRLFLVILMCFCINRKQAQCNKQKVSNNLEISYSKLVNLNSRGKVDALLTFFVFRAILLSKHKYYLNSWTHLKGGHLHKKTLSVVTSIVWNSHLKIY